MKINLKNKYWYFFIVLLLTVACNEDLTYDKVVNLPPVVSSFSPQAAPIGAEVVIKGENFSSVVAAYIGDVEMQIVEKLSNSQLTIRVSGEGKDGVIKLVNSVGEGISKETFSYAYSTPVIDSNTLPAEIDMGGNLLISGTYMASVKSVFFTAKGYEEGREATIVERNNSELVVIVPYVEADEAQITVSYYTSSSIETSELSTAPALKILRYKPEFDNITFERTAVGRQVVLSGRYLDKVDKLLVNGFEAMITKMPETLTFVVPEGDFQDGETETQITVEYFSGNETLTLENKLMVYVPFVKYWENISTWGHGKLTEQHSSFFSPETGRVYTNSDWSTVVDPISFQYKDATCPEAQISGVTQEEYNSVNPYFFFYAYNAGDTFIASPANKNNIFKNFYTSETSKGDFSGFAGEGTPILGFKVLDATKPNEAELIAKVKSQSLEKIDEEVFPADVANKTLGGIDLSVASDDNPLGAGVNIYDKYWAPGIMADKTQDNYGLNPDAVIMVMYYAHPGLQKDGDVFNYAQNIKRIGFVHVTGWDYITEAPGNSSPKPSLSKYTFNCYWQKYDYDYSKIKE